MDSFQRTMQSNFASDINELDDQLEDDDDENSQSENESDDDDE